MNITILGGGMSALSLAYFLQDDIKINEINIIEKENYIGGLCKSIHFDKYVYDIGPHIIFSKNKDILEFMIGLMKDKNKLHRSNKIIYKDRKIQYPFENDLSKLPERELEYCTNTFLNNPYEKYETKNMLQFFLKTFGEGITNLYLRPYNEKIWKFDLSFMNTKMVERIPNPTKEEIMRSAKGETVDGYLHQLYFYYPSKGGIETLVYSINDKLQNKCKIYLNESIEVIDKNKSKFILKTKNQLIQSDLVVSTIPPQSLSELYSPTPFEIKSLTKQLKYNSIIIAFVKTKQDISGNNFAFTIPDKDVIFHRISKMDFLGDYYKSDGATYIVEITFRKNDYIDNMSSELLVENIIKGIHKIKFADSINDVEVLNITRHEYAYVIYDLNHQINMQNIRSYYNNQGIYLNGRFGNFEYWNMDKVIYESYKLAQIIKQSGIEK